MISLIEEDDPKLVNIEKVTTGILENIVNELDIELNPYLLMEPVRSTDLDEDIGTKLIDELNKSFRKDVRLPYNRRNYIKDDVISAAENGIFNWLSYQTINKQFVIHSSNFKKYCSELVGQTISISEIIRILDLHIPDFKVKNVKVNGEAIKGFKIQWQELKKVFNIRFIDDEDLDDYY